MREDFECLRIIKGLSIARLELIGEVEKERKVRNGIRTISDHFFEVVWRDVEDGRRAVSGRHDPGQSNKVTFFYVLVVEVACNPLAKERQSKMLGNGFVY